MRTFRRPLSGQGCQRGSGVGKEIKYITHKCVSNSATQTTTAKRHSKKLTISCVPVPLDHNNKLAPKRGIQSSVLYGVPIFLAFSLYLNTLQAGFVYDDHRAIVNNPDVVGLSSISSVWFHDFWGAPLQRRGSHGSWRPLTTLSFRLNAFLARELTSHQTQTKVGGQSLSPKTAWQFHFTNILLHMAVTGAYIGMLQTVGINKLVCLWAGSLFAAHPVHVEAVGGVVGRAELLAGFTFCLAIGAYTFYIRGKLCNGNLNANSTCPCLSAKTDSDNKDTISKSIKNSVWLWISIGTTCLGLMCKEQAVTALGVAFILHAAILVTITPVKKNLLKNIISQTWLLCLLMAIIIWCRLTLSTATPSFPAADNPAAHATSVLTRTLSVGRYWALHARLLLLPHLLSFDWSMDAVPLVTSPVDTEMIPVVILILGSLCLVVTTVKALLIQKSLESSVKILDSICHDSQININNNNNISNNNNNNSNSCSSNNNNEVEFTEFLEMEREKAFSYPDPVHVAFALGLLVIPFLPASNLMVWVGFVAAERILYLPSMGAILLVALGSQGLVNRLKDSIPSLSKTTSRSFGHRKLERRRRTKRIIEIINILWILLVVLMGARTVKRNWDWYSDETLYKSGISICPAKALANLGVVYSDEGRLAEAELAYRKALEHAPYMADTHYNLGLLLSKTNRYMDAIESFKEAIKSRSWLAQAHVALASTLSQLGDNREAISVLEKCVSHAKAPAKDGMSHSWAITTCQQRLCRLYLQDGEPHLAIHELHKALQTYPPGYPAHTLLTLLAEAHVAAGEHAEAQEALSKALKAQPSHVPAHLAFSRLLQANGSKFEEAENWLRRAVALAPDDALAYKHLGQLLLEQGQAEAAVDPWLRSASLDPDDHTAAFNSATALRLAGRNHHAEIFYRKAVKLMPEDVSSQRNLGAILHLNGKLEEALVHYNKALALSPGDLQTTTNLNRLEAVLRKKRNL